MRIGIHLLLFLVMTLPSCSQQKVSISNGTEGFTLMLDNEAIFVNGMNWDYFPIGQNYSYSLWDENEAFIKSVLEYEMRMLQDLGVNVIRQYVGIPQKWISYIYETYGIYTILNHSFGRYGVRVHDSWHEHTNYEDVDMRHQLLEEIRDLAKNYKNTPGLLFYLLGNENNYGLFWEGSETEDIPTDVSSRNIQAKALYSLFNEASLLIKSIDTNHPVAMCNGDLLFMDIIVKTCKDVDIFGANVYRGMSFKDAFDCVKEKINKPFLITEFGADAYNSLLGKEDQFDQAQYFVENWKEIYSNAAGHGEANNSIGGLTFQFSDGWWKYGQTKNLDVHDTNASWSNGGYSADFVKGSNNMNEEWFGICAKEKVDKTRKYILKPRVAFHALKKVHQYDPLKLGTDIKQLRHHFSKINTKELTNISSTKDGAIEKGLIDKTQIEKHSIYDK